MAQVRPDWIKPYRGLIPPMWNPNFHSLFKGLKHCHLFLAGQGSSIYDLIKERPAHTMVGCSWTKCEYGPAINFTSGSDYIYTDINTEDNGFDFAHTTIIGWASTTEAGTGEKYIAATVYNDTDRVTFGMVGDDSIVIGGEANNGYFDISVVAPNSRDGDMHMWAGVLDTSHVALYLDDVALKEDGAGRSEGGGGAAQPWVIGDRSTGTANGWSGDICSVMIWNRSLSTEEVKLIYNLGPGLGMGSATDRIEIPFHGAIHGAGSAFNAAFAMNSNLVL